MRDDDDDDDDDDCDCRSSLIHTTAYYPLKLSLKLAPLGFSHRAKSCPLTMDGECIEIEQEYQFFSSDLLPPSTLSN